ncbi:hypothetical protein [Flavobacterium croceum]|uniref:hypothetical protein n=1 Tax=Flavobacterium croceum TaxID=370975 RepID=UPI0024A9E54A|nr:hypothetical protein [Flavobacterium croceum]
MNFTALKEKISQSQIVNFGDVLNETFELFKKTWLQGVLLVVVLFVLIFALEMLAFIPLAGVVSASELISPNAMKDFPLTTILLVFSVIITFICAVMTISNALMAGYYRSVKAIDLGESSGSDLMYYLKSNYLVKSFKVSLAQTGIIILCYITCFVPIIYVMVPVSFIVIAFAFNPDFSTGEILKVSFAIGNRNWVNAFFLRIVTSILAMLGIIACGIGVLATFSIALLPQYIIYKKVVGFDNSSEIDTIGSKVE